MDDRGRRTTDEPHIVVGMGMAQMWRTGATYRVEAPGFRRDEIPSFETAEVVLRFASRFTYRTIREESNDGNHSPV